MLNSDTASMLNKAYVNPPHIHYSKREKWEVIISRHSRDPTRETMVDDKMVSRTVLLTAAPSFTTEEFVEYFHEKVTLL